MTRRPGRPWLDPLARRQVREVFQTTLADRDAVTAEVEAQAAETGRTVKRAEVLREANRIGIQAMARRRSRLMRKGDT